MRDDNKYDIVQGDNVNDVTATVNRLCSTGMFPSQPLIVVVSKDRHGVERLTYIQVLIAATPMPLPVFPIPRLSDLAGVPELSEIIRGINAMNGSIALGDQSADTSGKLSDAELRDLLDGK